METNELRRGNNVLFKTQICVVAAIEEHRIAVYSCNDNVWSFEKTFFSPMLIRPEELKMLEQLKFYRQLKHNTDMEIKYMHQLQNLYFAITGKELVDVQNEPEIDDTEMYETAHARAIELLPKLQAL